jgi:TonB family protein
MKIQKLVVVLALLLSATLFTINAQDPSHKGLGAERKDTNKGEVDHMIDELKSRNQHVVKACLENCERSTTAQQSSGSEIVDKVIPEYPPIARAARATGTVVVRVIVDEEGKVIAAQSVSGHPLLQGAAVQAARQSTFKPYLLNGQIVKVTGTIRYDFKLM